MTLDPERCITCGDVTVTARVVEVRGQTATVELADHREQVGIELVEEVALGDLLVCHAGIALEKVASAQ